MPPRPSRARTTRRAFLGAAAALLPSRLRAAEKLPLSFSTLGCPRWSWRVVLEQATRSGYSAVELRGLEGEMNLTRRPEFAPSRIAATRRELQDRGLRISDVGASSRMHERDPARRRSALDEARAYIALADRLGAPYVRVFPDKWVEGELRETTIARIVDGLRELGEHARPAGVAVLLESHGDLTDSATLVAIMRGAASSSVAFLWDAHHTAVSGKEDPAHTFAALGSYVRHTHLKDSISDGKGGHRYVLTGKGTVPVRETVRVLVAGGYRGYYGFEWEKAWHPEIEEPEIAIPHYAETMRGYLAEAGHR